MKKVLFILFACTILPGCTQEQKGTQVELQSSQWSFDTSHSAQSSITAQTPEAGLTFSGDSTFTIKFNLDIPEIKEEIKILEIPEILKIVLRQADPHNRKSQNYPAYKMPDGTVPVLEASLSLQLPMENNAIRNLVIGVPLAMLDDPKGKHDVIVNFSGVCWTIYVDGKLLDNEFALGYPVWSANDNWTINPQYIAQADMYFPGIQPEKVINSTPEISHEIQYWTPPGHNSWVGDVATFFHNGRYHVFYLYDRRTHGSKFGRGAHYFEHISTNDFKTWIEHEAATPIEAQWETFGTGVPFIFDGKFCISYGLHTTRIYPAEMTTLPIQWEYYREHGYTGTFHNNTTPGIPAGSTYSISEDGITNFKKTNIMFHPCENPSVYTDPDGKLKMLANYGAKGTWESQSIDGGWRSINPDFPPGGDCTFFFRWNNFDYIIGGFTGLWSKPATAPESEFKSLVSDGIDFYNGMSVPAITEIPGNRFLMAGWLQMHGWGGTLNIHELIQFHDGQIGTKWMEEIVPETISAKTLAKEIKETTEFSADSQSFLLTFDVHPNQPGKGKVGIVLKQENGTNDASEIQININEKRAQYSNSNETSFAGKEKTLREGGAPQAARNYAIENLLATDKPFTVRVIVKATDKFGGSQIDTEIAGTRTMISYRPDLFVKDVLFRTDGVKLKNIKIAPLKY